MKRTRLTNASILALALVASPVMAQTSTTTTDQTTTQPQTDQSTTQPQTETTPPTTTTESNVTSTPATSTDQSLPATGSPMPTVIAVSLAAMAVGAWLSRPQPRI